MYNVEDYAKEHGEWRDISYFGTISCPYCGAPIQTHDCLFREDGFTGKTATLNKEGTCFECNKTVKWVEDIEIVNRRVRG